MMKRKLSIQLTLIVVLSVTNGCHSTVELPKDVSTVALYRQNAMQQAAKMQTHRTTHRAIQSGRVDLRGYSRSEVQALDTHFSLLPNPELSLYVFPHLEDGAPIPGYVTTFKLYLRDIYALPGEL